jgi:hemerythrin-like domain-containing protein
MSGAESGSDAISLLKSDHETVKRLFERFEKADSPSAMQKAIDDAIHALKIHATIEEEIFYPAIREDVGEELVDQAREEHHIARVLIAELDALTDDKNLRNAKFKVLVKGIKQHIKEEEGEIFPDAARIDLDFNELAGRIMQRKDELIRDGVPIDAEHHMVSGTHVSGGASSAAKQDRSGI